MQHQGRDTHIDQDGEGIHDGGDEGAGHDGGVKAHPLGTDGEQYAHDLGQKHGAEHGDAYDQGG